ncbi:MAG: Gfo/Idh/MocA family protein [Planctomycetota bacterium]|jgi:predicted dehydrogenase
MNEIRWGIIGCGDVTEQKSGPAFQQVNGSRLVAVMRRNKNLAADYAHRHQVKKWYDDAQKLVDDPEVTAVYIATPPSSHKDYAIAVANAGKPVYVEKPMALNYSECQEMIQACKNNDVPLFVAYYRRALPRFVKIKSLLDNGAIGKTRFANVTFYKKTAPDDLQGAHNWRVDPNIAGGGACHSIDLLQFFFGEIKTVKGHASNQQKLYNAEDTVSGLLLFENLVHVSYIWNFNAYSNLDRTEIVGDKGKITFSTFENNPIVLENEQGTQQFNIENPENIQQPLIQTIVNQLRGNGTCPSTGLTAAKTNWVMDSVELES